jgi:NADH-quinone oxidoreductase subunit N
VGAKLSFFVLLLSFYLCQKKFWLVHSLVTTFYVFDFIGVFFKCVLLVAVGICLLVSVEFLIKQQLISFEYFVLVLFSAVAMLLLLSSCNLISVFLALELQSFCFYILASAKKTSIYSTEAGLKYFLLGALASSIVLFGSSLLYGFTGSTNFVDFGVLVFSQHYGNLLIYVATFFILVGFLFKLGAFPFHSWLPDVYEGAPTSTSLFFAVSSKIATVVVLVRFLQVNFNVTVFNWQYLFLSCGLLSIFFGSLLALKQKKMKRLLAFSSISHVGYLFLAMSVTNLEGFFGVFFYLFFYTISAASVWCLVINAQNSIRFFRSPSLGDFCSIFRNNITISLSFLIAVFSMAGVPPLVGFYAKLCIFFSVINSCYFVFVILAFLTTVISSFFYVRLIKTAFFEKSLNENLFESLTCVQAKTLTICSFSLVFFFVNPSLLDVISLRVALSL